MCFPSDVNDAGHWLSNFFVPGHAAETTVSENLLKNVLSESCSPTKVKPKHDENKNLVGDGEG